MRSLEIGRTEIDTRDSIQAACKTWCVLCVYDILSIRDAPVEFLVLCISGKCCEVRFAR